MDFNLAWTYRTGHVAHSAGHQELLRVGQFLARKHGDIERKRKRIQDEITRYLCSENSSHRLDWNARGLFEVIDPKIVKTEQQYREYLAEVERLASEDPPTGTDECDRLELLAKLVQDYEKEKYTFDAIDPVDAILFRMDQKQLRQKDVAPLMGGKNRASEVLSRKRPLTIAMVRALSEALAIPADLLISDPQERKTKIGLDRQGNEAMLGEPNLFEDGDEYERGAFVHSFLKPAQGPLYLRRTITYGATPTTNKLNLQRWVSRVREIAEETRSQRGRWDPMCLNIEFLKYVAKLSWSERGPEQAKKFLAEKGIALVIHPALPQTKLDGAAMQDQTGAPIVGLTIRHDRLDNFWFTLIHELVHAWKHLPEKDMAITDESIEDSLDDDAKEAEANRIARDTFIPRSVWTRSDAFLRPSARSIHALANKLHISPAIVAGRLRRERAGYKVFGNLVGSKKVQVLFPETKWE